MHSGVDQPDNKGFFRTMISDSRKLLLLLPVMYFIGIFDHDLWAPMDTRGAGMIWGMWDSGNWAVPVINGHPYLEKPPLMHWTALILALPFGVLTEGLLRLPSALYGLGTAMILYLWGRRYFTAQVGLAAAYLCTGTLLYLEYSRVVFTDITLTFMVIYSMWLFWRGYDSHQRGLLRFLPFIFVSALAFFAKGLVGVAFIWVPIVAFLIHRRNWQLLSTLLLAYAPILILLVGLWAWRLWLTGGEEYLRIVFIDNQLGRFFTFSDKTLPADPYFVHKEPLYFYLLDLPLRILPWVFILPVMLFDVFWLKRVPRTAFILYVKWAVICMLLILHASEAKVSTYTLPLLPLLYLLAAVWLQDELQDWRSRLRQLAILLGGLSAALLALLPPLLIVSLYFLPTNLIHTYLDDVELFAIVGEPVTQLLLIASILLVGIVLYSLLRAVRLLRTDQRATLLASFPATMALLFAVGVAMFTQLYNPHRSCKPVANQLKKEIRQGHPVALGTQSSHVTGCMTFYLNRKLAMYSTASRAEDFLNHNEGAVLLTESEELEGPLAALTKADYSIKKVDYPGIVARSYYLLRKQ